MLVVSRGAEATQEASRDASPLQVGLPVIRLSALVLATPSLSEPSPALSPLRWMWRAAIAGVLSETPTRQEGRRG